MMYGKFGTTLIAGLALVAISACSTTDNVTALGQIDDLVVQSENPACKVFLTDKGRLNPEKLAEVVDNLLLRLRTKSGGDNLSYDSVLDCIFGTIKGNDEVALNKHLLRAHILVTLVARYAAFNVTGDVGGVKNVDFTTYDEIGDDAATILSHLELVEDLLRIRASKIPSKAAEYTSFKRDMSGSVTAGKLANLDHFAHVNRLYLELAILQLVIDSERPTYRRLKKAIFSIISAIATENPAAAKPAANAAIAGLGKIAVLRRFAPAYIQDANEYVGSVKPDFTFKKDAGIADWQHWDALLIEACDRLADTGQAKNHCLKDDEITAARKQFDGS